MITEIMRKSRWIFGGTLVVAFSAASALVLTARRSTLESAAGVAFRPAAPSTVARLSLPAASLPGSGLGLPADIPWSEDAPEASSPTDGPPLSRPRASTLIALEPGSETPRAQTPLRPKSPQAKPGRPLAPPAPLVAAGFEPQPHSADVPGIKAALGEIVPQIRECYDAWLDADPSHSPVGRVTLAFTIEPDPNFSNKAQVVDAGVTDAELDPELLEGCVVAATRTLRFQPPDEPVDVTYPLDFARE